MEKLDEMVALQQDMVAVRDQQHRAIDTQFAWLTPMVHTIAKRLNLE